MYARHKRMQGFISETPRTYERRKYRWLPVCERLRARWNCYEFQHFINGFKRENPRHLFKQLSAVEAFLETENPSRRLVAEVMKACCENYRYQFTQFSAVYEQMSLQNRPSNVTSMDYVQRANFKKYQQAFLERSVN